MTDIERPGIEVQKELASALMRNLRCGEPAVEVAAAESVAALALGATYEFHGTFYNKTDRVLRRRGMWPEFDPKPAEIVPPYGSTTWSVKGNGFSLDIELVYQRDGADFQKDQVFLVANIPLLGDNSYAAESDIPGTTASYQNGSGGWNAVCTYYLK